MSGGSVAARRRHGCRRPRPRAGSMRPRTSPSGSPRSTTSSPSSRKRAGRAVRQLDRLLAVPAQLDQAAALARAPGRRSCRWRAGRRSGGSLRSPSGARSAARSTSTGGACSSARSPRRSAPPRAGCRTPTAPRAGTAAARAPAARRPRAGPRSSLERHDPVADRGGERLAEERPERLVLPGLDVARRPVVHEHHPEDVVERALDRHRLAHRLGVPITKPASSSMSSRSLGPNSPARAAGRSAAAPASRSAPPCPARPW